MTEKPLHVQVAEALRWTELMCSREPLGAGLKGWVGEPPRGWAGPALGVSVGGKLARNVPNFPEDRDAAASLIDELGARGWGVHLVGQGSRWSAWCFRGEVCDLDVVSLDGGDELGTLDGEIGDWKRALCFMVLRLAQEGKLHA